MSTVENRQPIPYRSSVLIFEVAPTTVVGREPLNETDDGATCEFRVYDPAVDEVISSDEASGQTVLSVTNPEAFSSAAQVEVELDDGTLQVANFVDVDADAGTIEIDAGLTSAASAGNRVREKLGNTVSMSEYGTPVLGARDWGFVGILASDHPGLALNREIDVEIDFVGNPAGGVDLLDVLYLVVKPNRECEGTWVE